MSLLTLLAPHFGVPRARAGIGDWRDVGCERAAATPSVTDNFNRADSTTGLGGGWTTNYRGVWGISSGEAYPYSGQLNNGYSIVTGRDFGSASVDITVDVRMLLSYTGVPRCGIIFGWDGLKGNPSGSIGGPDPQPGPGGVGYILKLAGASSHYLSKMDGTDQNGGTALVLFGGAPLTATPQTIRIVYNAATGNIKCYSDGTLYIDYTDTSPLTGTFIGLQSDSSETAPSGSQSSYRFDNFSAAGLTPPTLGQLDLLLPGGGRIREACAADTLNRHPLRIEDPANPGTWIDVACMVPA